MSTRRTVNKRNYDAICADYNSGTMKLNEICQKYNLKSQQTVYNIVKTHSIDNTDKQPIQNNYKPIDRQINRYADKPVEKYTEKLTAAERKSAQYVDEIMQNRQQQQQQQQSKQNDINVPKRSKEEYERRRQMLEVSSNLVNNYING